LAFFGGGLIDEVGLGKTIQMITLSKLNPSTEPYINKMDKTKLYSKATLILCPNHLCGQWVRELKNRLSNKDNTSVINIMTKTHFNKHTYHDILNADFVILSYTFLDNNAFVSKWIPKLSKFKNYHRGNWSPTDINNVRKVFKNMGKELVKNYLQYIEKRDVLFPLIHWHRIVVDEFHEISYNFKYVYIRNILPFIKGTYKWIMSATPFIDTNSLYDIVDFLTDYNNKDSLNILTNDKIINYLSTDCFRKNTKKSIEEEHILPPIKEEIIWLNFSPTERIMYNAYLANNNNDVYSTYLRKLCCHPQLADETKHALSNCKSLKEIEIMMVSHYKNEVNIATEKVQLINNRILKIENKSKNFELRQKKRLLEKKGFEFNEEYDITDSENEDEILLLMNEEYGVDYDIYENKKLITVENLTDNLVNLKRMKVNALNILKGKTSTYNFFKTVVSKLKEISNKAVDTIKRAKYDIALNKEENLINLINDINIYEDDVGEICGVCLEEIEADDLGVTKCGHIFCYDCLKISVVQYERCPTCNGKLKNNEIIIVPYNQKKTKNTYEHKEKNELINKIGTKLANLILYLRKHNEHTIIFSQWDDLLMRVGRTLRENNIKNVFCKGNCYQRDKAIRDFNSDVKIKVIMLSSDSAASGTNLTKASQVILLDPIYGDYNYRKKQEKQAIGRAHRLGQEKNIKVIRFIVKNSIEEDIYNMNLEEDKKHALIMHNIQD